MNFQNVNVKGVNYPKTLLGKAKMDKICNAAINLFAEKNFYETSISDICKAAKTAIGTFYIYFADKAALYNFLVFNYKVEIFACLRDALTESDSKSRKEKERAGIKAFIKYAYARPYLYSIIWGVLSVDPQAFTDYYTSFSHSYVKGLTHDQGQLKNDIDLSTLSYVLMGITNFVGLKMIFEKNMDEEKLEKVMNDVIDLLENGVLK